MDVFVGVGGALLVVGALVAWYGVRSHRRLGQRHAAARATWRQTSASIVDARLIDREESNSEGYDTNWYDPQLHYSFALDGRTFDGRRTALVAPLRFATFEPAQKWLLANAPGSTIDVWYDPADPADNAPLLDRPSRVAAMTTIATGGMVAIFGAAVMLHMI